MFRLALTTVLLSAAALPAQSKGFGTFFTLTNGATDNQVQVGVRVFNKMVPLWSYSTGDKGTGAGLGSQAAIAASGHYLVAVNAGSDSITLFRWHHLVLLSRSDTAQTGGTRPTSVAVRGNLVYVLNADSDNLTGFRIKHGSLKTIGMFKLSGTGVAAAQVGFSPRGHYLVVTERATDQILVYPVKKKGDLGKPMVNKSEGKTPFGFVFRRDGTLIVSEAAGGDPGASSASSYEIKKKGKLKTISKAVPTTQTAACWVAIPRKGDFAYTTNTGSSTVTGFRVKHKGRLKLLDKSGVTGQLAMGARPIDAAFNGSGTLLFVLDSGNDQIVSFYRDHKGGLHLLPGSVSLPDGAAGLIAR